MKFIFRFPFFSSSSSKPCPPLASLLHRPTPSETWSAWNPTPSSHYQKPFSETSSDLRYLHEFVKRTDPEDEAAWRAHDLYWFHRQGRNVAVEKWVEEQTGRAGPQVMGTTMSGNLGEQQSPQQQQQQQRQRQQHQPLGFLAALKERFTTVFTCFTDNKLDPNAIHYHADPDTPASHPASTAKNIRKFARMGGLCHDVNLTEVYSLLSEDQPWKDWIFQERNEVEVADYWNFIKCAKLRIQLHGEDEQRWGWEEDYNRESAVWQIQREQMMAAKQQQQQQQEKEAEKGVGEEDKEALQEDVIAGEKPPPIEGEAKMIPIVHDEEHLRYKKLQQEEGWREDRWWKENERQHQLAWEREAMEAQEAMRRQSSSSRSTHTSGRKRHHSETNNEEGEEYQRPAGNSKKPKLGHMHTAARPSRSRKRRRSEVDDEEGYDGSSESSKRPRSE